MITPLPRPDGELPLDALALVSAIHDHDGAALSWLLDSGDNRQQASMLASMMSELLTPEQVAGLRESFIGLRQAQAGGASAPGRRDGG